MKIRKSTLRLATIGAAVLTTTSIVAPLLSTSCSTAKKAINAIGAEYDKEYNVDEATYKSLKNVFWSRLRDDLKKNPVTNNPEYIERAKRRTYKTFERLESQCNNLSYTALSSAVVEYASRVYGYKLCQTSTANWNDVYKMFEGMKKSFRIYMEHCDLDDTEINAITNDARIQFNNFVEDPVTGLKAKYEDPLFALIEAKSFLTVCFADINSEIGLAAAANRLSQFMQDYTITFNDEATNNRLDQIENKLTAYDEEKQCMVTFKIGADITPFMTTVFNITRNRDGHVLQPGEYTRHLLPGYTISPILKNISRNPFENKYTLDVDWQCVKTNYVEKYPERVEATTAHVYKADRAQSLASDNEQTVDESKLTLKDLFPSDSISTVSYSILLTPEAQRQALYDCYFNPNFSPSASNQFTSNYLEFKWDSTKTSYDAFFRGKKLHIEGEKANEDATSETHVIEAADLAESGLMVAVKQKGASNDEVQYKRLDDFIATQGNFTAEKRQNNEGLNDILNKFFENCVLTSEVELTNIDTEAHEAKNTLYAQYRNTDNPNGSRYQYNATPINTNGFPIGESSYYFLTSRYNQLRDYAEVYANNQYGEEHDELEFEMGLTGALFGLTFILQGVCLLGVILHPTKAIWYWAIILTALASMGFQSASLAIFIKHKWNISDDYDKKTAKFSKTQECKDFINMLDAQAEQFSLLRTDATRSIDSEVYYDEDHYQKYQKKSWTEVRGIINQYQDINLDDTFKAFQAKAEASGISAKKYEDEMAKWDIGERYWNETISFDASSFALDIANMILMWKAPEVIPAGAAVKNNDDLSIATKMKDLEKTKDIKRTNQIVEDLKCAPQQKAPTQRFNNSPFRSNGVISEKEMDVVKDIKTTLNPIDAKQDARTVQGGKLWNLFFGTKETEFLKTNEDLAGKYANNQWKLFKQRYGDPGTHKNAFKNFVKYATTISKEGECALPLGPETLQRHFAISCIDTIDGDFVTVNKRLADLIRNFDHKGKIPEEFITKIEKCLDFDESVKIYDDLLDNIIPKNFKLSKFTDILSEKAANNAGDIIAAFGIVGPIYDSFNHAMGDIWTSYEIFVKIKSAIW